jgi:hypothetical protein
MVRFLGVGEQFEAGLLRQPPPLFVVTGRATGNHIVPTVPTSPGNGEDVISGKELAALQFAPMFATVLAGVVVSGEKEGVGNLPAKAPGYMDKTNQSDDQWKRDLIPLRSERPGLVSLQKLCLPVKDQPDRPPYGDDRQWFIRSVKS